MWIAMETALDKDGNTVLYILDADEDQTELLRRLTDEYGLDRTLQMKLSQEHTATSLYGRE